MALVSAALVASVIGWQLHRHGWDSMLQLTGAPVAAVKPAIPVRPVEYPPPLAGGDASVSAEPLKLLLTGTRVGARPDESVAFIGTARRNPQTYATGALLANGARIVSITADYVVLERDGARARIDVSRESQMATGAEKGRAGAIDSVGGPMRPEPDLSVSTEVVTDFIRPRPVFDETGRFVAYELQPGADAAAFQRLGLQPGDRLVATDGVPLAGVEQAAAALQMISSGAAVAAQVQRSDQVIALRLDGQRIADGGAGAATDAPQTLE